jgi:hypothetical protein
MKRFFFNYWILIGLALSFGACDQIKDDELPNPTPAKTLITKPNAPLLQDLTKLHALTQPATFSLQGKPKRGEAKFVKAGLLMYTPNANVEAAQDTVIYRICMEGKCEDASLGIEILPQGNEPEPEDVCEQGAFADIVSLTLPSNELIINVLENDTFCLANADANTLQIAVPPTKGVANVQAGKIVYQINPSDFVGGEIETFVYQVAEQGKPDNIKYAAVVVNIKSGDCELVANNDIIRFNISTNPLKIKVLENDIFCNTPKEFTNLKILQSTQKGMLTISGNEIIYQLTANDAKPGQYDYFFYQVAEKNKPDKLKNAWVRIKFEPSSCDLIVNDDSYQIEINGGLYANIWQNDSFCQNQLDADTLKAFKIVSPPSHGKVVGSTFTRGAYEGWIGYHPNLDYEGNDQFTYQITYKDGTNKQATVRIKIEGGTKCIDSPPQAKNDEFTFKNVDLVQYYNSTADLNLSGNDIICYPASDYTKTKITQNIPSNLGTLRISQACNYCINWISYTLPNPTFTGTVVFKYQICDIYNRCSEATVTLNIID